MNRTKVRKSVKIIVDILMYGLYVYLMGYRIIRRLDMHGYLGIALLILFIIHHILNISWWKVLFRGKYSPRRIALTVTDLLLLLAMAGLGISSVLHLCQVFPTSWYIPMTQFSRDLHLLSSAWGFVIMSIHLGFHTIKIFSKLWKLKGIGPVLFFLIFVLGAYCFYRSGLWSDMFLLMAEKESYLNIWDYFAGYILITAFLCQTVFLFFGFKPKKL